MIAFVFFRLVQDISMCLWIHHHIVWIGYSEIVLHINMHLNCVFFCLLKMDVGSEQDVPWVYCRHCS